MSQKFSGKRAYSFLKKIGFIRFAGSSGELKASKIIAESFRNMGYNVSVERFKIWSYKIIESSLEVLEPYRKIPCRGVGLTGNTPDDGVIDKLIYIEDAGKRFLEKGGIWLYYGGLDVEKYRDITKYGPKALIRVEENPSRNPSYTDIPVEWWQYGKIPMIRVKYGEAYRLMRSKYKKVRVKLIQNEFKTFSRNIVAEKIGEKYPDEIIVIGAHYDSEYGTIGATDNAAGTAVLMELARIFSSKKNMRTIRFIAFGAEELGLLGSRKYAESHRKDLEKVKLMVNIDVQGSGMGRISAIVSGGDDIKNYIEILGKELGINIRVTQGIASSDSTSFAWKNIPSISFSRSGGSTFYMHTEKDDLKYVNPLGLEISGILLETFLDRVINAIEYPFKREIPENIKKNLKEYFEKRIGIKIK
ncbi:MAG: hypothetical protein DRJ34_00145 [Thermoprotei archaeon]|nr:MAG: hypothetical protein DRJ34_00145 [Thermoprotei archaeon]RLE72666.1 MAG: hypothetical protein DRJ45_01430 [Thermoprotei archaeon]